MNRKLLMLAVMMVAFFTGSASAEPSGPYRLVFITSTNLGVPAEWDCATSMDGVNEHVQNLATAAGLPGIAWTAIASTSYLDARDNTNTNPTLPDDILGNGTGVPIYLVDGTTLVANNNADLWDGEIAHIINQDESGTTKGAWPHTGTYLDGTVADPGDPDYVTYGRGFDDPSSVTQGCGTVTTQWIFRQSTQRPPLISQDPKSANPVYAISEVLGLGSYPTYIYPKNEAVVDTSLSDDVTLIWQNIELDPEDANDIYVEVLFGTDPNETFGDMAPLTLDPVSGLDVNSVTVMDLKNGIYYWQVNTTIGTDPCVIKGPVYSFETKGDFPPDSVDIGPDMITWSGKGVDLTAIVSGDDGISPLEYTWTYDAPDDVTVDIDTTAGDDIPTVTVTKVSYLEPYAVNGSFEDPVLADGAEAFCAHNSTAVASWIQTWYSVSEGIWKRGGYKAGAVNPTVYTNIPEGENVGFIRSDTADNALQQDTSLIIQPNTTYTLSAKAGNSSATATTTCRIEIGGATLAAASPSTASPDPCDWTLLTCTYISGADSTVDANVGQSLSIRLVAEAHAFGDLKQVDYDDVVLTIDGQSGDEVYNTEMSQVTINVAVIDGNGSTPVTDSMTIDVYETACQAAGAYDPESYDPGDIDKNCITDIVDLAEMAKTWLNDQSLSEPAEKP